MPAPSTIVRAAVLGVGPVVALLLSTHPLLGVLGYESAAVMGVVLGLVSLGWGLWRWRGGPGPLGAHPVGPLASFVDALPFHLALVLPPLLVLGGAEWLRGSCDVWTGLAFWLWIPLPSVAIAQALAWAIASLLRSDRVRWAVAVAAVLGDVGLFVFFLATQPPITGHSWLFGWFAGSFYDQAITLPDSLLYWRAMWASQVAVGLLALELRWRWSSGRTWQRPAWLLAMVGPVALALWSQRTGHGIERTREDIARELGATVTTEHFVIHYDASAFSEETLRQLMQDHEFRYAELREALGVDPVEAVGRRVGSYLYPDAKVQQRLLGSRQTFVARPWTHEMHLRWSRLGEPALAHELSHVFSAGFGAGPLALATRGCGLCVDLAMVEGLATAADWPPSELTPHEVAAGLRALGQAPDLRRVFGLSGFWSQPSGKAYTLVGSFVRWLWDEHGIASLRQVYGHGDYEQVYGTDVLTLIGQWEAFVDSIELDEQHLALVAYRYDRGSLFERACARTVAELERTSRLAAWRGDHTEALRITDELLRFEPDDPEHHVERAETLLALDRGEEAGEVLKALLAGEALSLAWEARVREELGDVAWSAGALEEAARAYRRTLTLGLPDARRRRVLVKLAGLGDAEVRDIAFDYLVDEHSTALRGLLVREWAARRPDDALPRYLVGLQWFNQGRFAQAVPWLEGPPGTLAAPSLDGERRWRLAVSLVQGGQLEEARAVLAGLARDTSSRLREEAKDEQVRLEWLDH